MIGKTISRYTVIEKLGAGGMGEVYLADDTELDRRVAIKFLPSGLGATPDMLERFKREAKAAAALSHPNIITVYDVGTHEGRPYIVMEHVAGEPLSKVIERGDLTVDGSVAIAVQVFEGLSAAHEAGVIHRDIKPDNILVDPSGRVRIVDFGLARLHGVVTVTAEASTVGTIHYMSPEQARGEKLDPRSDLFSAGVVVYEMVAGKRPFPGEHREAVLYGITSVDPKPLCEHNQEAGEELERIVTRLLAKDREERYASAKEVLEDLHRECGTAIRPVPLWRRRRPLASRGSRVTLGMGAVLIAVTAVAAWQAWWPFDGGAGAPPEKRDWILVAEFESPPGDSTLAPAAQSLLSSALDQSQIVATVPRDQILQALVAAGKPKNTRVDALVAKELAYRSSVRSVLEGTIGRLGKGYSLVVNVKDAEDSHLVLTKSATAKDDDALISMIGEMAKELRKGLGENRHALRATRPMNLVATPSFEAYKLYVQGGRVYGRGTANRAALRYYRTALAIDPDFASAWLAASTMYSQLGLADSARTCLEEARRRPERLTLSQREGIERSLAYQEGDYRAVVASYDRILAGDPGNAAALAAANDALWRLGRVAEALERTRKAMSLVPFGPSEGHRFNETAGLMFLGRYDEAREANQRMTGIYAIPLSASIELCAGRFALAESIAVAHLDDPRLIDDYPSGMRFLLAQAQFGRGAVLAAAATRKRMDEIDRPGNPFWADIYFCEWIESSSICEGAMPMPPNVETPDTSAAALLAHGLEAVVEQDPAVARSCLEAVRARPGRELVELVYAPELLEAQIHVMAGRCEEAVRVLRPIDGFRWGQGVGLTWIHWCLADAFEQMAQPDSAAFYLERSVALPGFGYEMTEKPFLHRRLAILYARMDRLMDAERHLAAAEKAWDRPDPEVRHMLELARGEVLDARDRALPDRP